MSAYRDHVGMVESVRMKSDDLSVIVGQDFQASFAKQWKTSANTNHAPITGLASWQWMGMHQDVHTFCRM